MINGITEQTVQKIKQNSVISLPDEPSKNGISTNALKERFVAPVVGGTNSITFEVNRVVNEINNQYGNVENTLDANKRVAFAVNATNAENSINSIKADIAENAVTATNADNAINSINSTHATNADIAINLGDGTIGGRKQEDIFEENTSKVKNAISSTNADIALKIKNTLNDEVLTIWAGTESQFKSIAQKNPGTMYFIMED